MATDVPVRCVARGPTNSRAAAPWWLIASGAADGADGGRAACTSASPLLVGIHWWRRNALSDTRRTSI